MNERIEYLEKILRATTPRRSVNQAILAVIGGTLLFRSGYDFAMRNSPRITVSPPESPTKEAPYDRYQRLRDLNDKMRKIHKVPVLVHSYGPSLYEIPGASVASQFLGERHKDQIQEGNYMGWGIDEKDPDVFYFDRDIPLKTPNGVVIESPLEPFYIFSDSQFQQFIQDVPEGNWNTKGFTPYDENNPRYSDSYGAIYTLIPSDNLPNDRFILFMSHQKSGRWVQQDANGSNISVELENKNDKYIFLSYESRNPRDDKNYINDKLAILVVDIDGQAIGKKIIESPHMPNAG